MATPKCGKQEVWAKSRAAQKKNRKEGDPEREVGQNNKAAKPRITVQMHSITKEISYSQMQVSILSLTEKITLINLRPQDNSLTSEYNFFKKGDPDIEVEQNNKAVISNIFKDF